MESTSMDDDSQRARFVRLKTEYNAGRPAVTVLLGRRYLVDYPDHWPVWVWLGDALKVLHRYDEAEEALTQAFQRCPEHKRRLPMIDFGHLHEARDDLERAARWYHKAIEAQPRHAAGYIFLGGVLARQGRLREAEEVHRNATETCHEGSLDEAFLNLGLDLLAQERFREAAECFREAIHRDPDDRVAKRARRDVQGCLRARDHRF